MKTAHYALTNAAWAAAIAEDSKVAPQANGPRYAGPIVEDRWQVMESYVGKTFYVVDHTLPDLLFRHPPKTGDILRFNSKFEAEVFIRDFTSSPDAPISRASNRGRILGEKQETKMAGKPGAVVRSNKALADAKKAAAVADAQLGPKTKKVPAKGEAALNGMREKIAAATSAKTKQAPAAASNGSGKPGRTPTEGKQTASSYIRMLLSEGKLSDDKILEKTREEFSHLKVMSNAVKWHRAKMEAAGTL